MSTAPTPSAPNGLPATARMAFVAVGLCYIGLRIAAWSQTAILEDYDSIGFLDEAAAWRSFDATRIATLSPDSTPLYPLLSALLSFALPSLEVATRSVSFLASLGLFAVFLKLGRELLGWQATLVAAALMAVNPNLIALSFAVLTEPLHIALVYFGLWIYWRGKDSTRLTPALACGVVFALAFLDRTESIVFLVLIPVLKLVQWRLDERPRAELKRITVWCSLYCAVFMLAISPQVISVSQKLGHPAINGRQLWFAIINNPDGRSENEKIFGLDYAPNTTNLVYLQSHPQLATKLAAESKASLGGTVKVAVDNVWMLARWRLRDLVGWLVLAAFVWGYARLWSRERRHVLVFLTLVGGAILAGPLAYNVIMRHVAIAIPLVLLLAGCGILDLGQRASRWLPRVSPNLAVAGSASLLVSITLWRQAGQIASVLQPTRANGDYDFDALQKPLALTQAIAKTLGRPPMVCATRSYLSEFTGANFVPLPFTRYDRLPRYLADNRVDLLFLELGLVNKAPFEPFPFVQELLNDPTAKGGEMLELIYRGPGVNGADYLLYRVQPNRNGAADVAQ